MAQTVTLSFAMRYGTNPQRFTPSDSSSALVAGVGTQGGFNFDLTGGASVLSRVLLPINCDYDTGSGPGDDAFKFYEFPTILDSAGNAIPDYNGLPLDFTKITLLAFRVRAIDPDAPWGGAVSIATTDVVPGNTFGQNDISSECTLMCQLADGWTPGASSEILVKFVPTTAASAELVNAMVEMIVIGNPEPASAPAFSAVPTISGTESDGNNLTAVSGTYTGTPAPVSGWQWERCDVGGDLLTDISGAIYNTYTLQSADIGFTIRARQVLANSEGAASARSLSSGVISA